jgi:hypothetical protein
LPQEADLSAKVSFSRTEHTLAARIKDETFMQSSQYGLLLSWRAAATALCAVILAASAATCAEATTITLDLNELATGAFTAPLTIDGFVLTPRLNGSSTPEIENFGGTNVLSSTGNIGSAGADTFLTMADGGSFSMVSLSMADNYSDLIGVASGSVDLTYGRALALYPTLTVYSYSSDFQDITSIDLDPLTEGGNPVIGDITVSFTPSTPEPGGLALLGLGLAGLVLAKRFRLNSFIRA